MNNSITYKTKLLIYKTLLNLFGLGTALELGEQI